ncbi:UDP-glucosyltransferase 2-like [Armigeres subalbatus]|uniref:UDP-glucosyltransferase 2-like n=1 Tax=Armigeres subalbatus TaxID=124917 RepID=UPI002ED49218
MGHNEDEYACDSFINYISIQRHPIDQNARSFRDTQIILKLSKSLTVLSFTSRETNQFKNGIMQRCAIILLLVACSLTRAANILYIDGVASPSHFIWHKALIHALAAKGHNVTALSVDVEDKPVQNVTYIKLEGVYESLLSEEEGSLEMDFFEIGDMNTLSVLYMFNEYTVLGCKFTLNTKGLKQLLDYPRDFKFDLIISDYLNGPCVSSVAQHRFGRPPLIGATAFHGLTTTTPMTGAYSYSASVPNHEFNHPQAMSYCKRFENFVYNHFEELSKVYYMLPQVDKIVRKEFPDIPYVGDLEKETRIVLLNSNPVIQYSEPTMPNVISVGGMQIVKSKELPDDLKKVVENAKNGAILFSLGTNLRSDMLGDERLIEILNAMGHFPEYQFLWKFESDKMPIEVPKNVYIRKWMPQNDLLAHPNVKLFITHSGLLSTQEAVWNGVPIIGFPVFADQHQNINYCVQQGVGKRLSLKNVKSKELVDAIKEVMADGRYRQNMSELSRLFRDQKETPLERAVWWVEWVLRNPTTQILQSNAIRLSWFAKYSFDVIVPILLVVFVVLSISAKVVCKVLHSKKRQTKVKGE